MSLSKMSGAVEPLMIKKSAIRFSNVTSNRQLFCSRDCWNQARQEQREAAREAERGDHYYRQRTCAVCGHSYWPTHSQQEFCSDECRRVNHNKKTLEFYHKKKGNLNPDPEATPTPKPKEDNAA